MPHKIGHSWGDLGSSIKKRVTNSPKRWSKRVENVTKADRKGNIIQRAAHDIKVRKEDKEFLKKTKAEIKDKKARGGDGTGAGLTAEDRLAQRKKHRVWKEKREDMRHLKKTNPAEYKKRKKAQLKKERLKAFTSSSSTWD